MCEEGYDTPAETNAMPNGLNENPALYKDMGYVVVRGLASQQVVEAYNRHLENHIASLAPGQRWESLVEPHVRARDWREWLELARDPRVLDAVSAALGADELLLLMTHLIVKPPRDGLKVEWHQDNTYWPSVTGTDVTTVWLALDDTDEGNACMHVIPSSHSGYEALEMQQTDGGDLLSVKVDVTPEMESAAVPVRLAAGDASLHDSFIIHGSGANHSDRRRAGYTMRYANACTVEVDLPNHHKPVYYVRGEGAGFRDGYRDIRAGRPLPDHPGEHTSPRFART
jgi:ectoine hydroxylase-related dioxygenase (phytanoyl-CoA dioxygenase family)